MHQDGERLTTTRGDLFTARESLGAECDRPLIRYDAGRPRAQLASQRSNPSPMPERRLARAVRTAVIGVMPIIAALSFVVTAFAYESAHIVYEDVSTGETLGAIESTYVDEDSAISMTADMSPLELEGIASIDRVIDITDEILEDLPDLDADELYAFEAIHTKPEVAEEHSDITVIVRDGKTVTIFMQTNFDGDTDRAILIDYIDRVLTDGITAHPPPGYLILSSRDVDPKPVPTASPEAVQDD